MTRWTSPTPTPSGGPSWSRAAHEFIDSKVFLHAFLKPRRELTPQELETKAKETLGNVEVGEEVATSTVHLSEVVNIIESGLSLQRSLGFLAWAISKANVDVFPTDVGDYGSALSVARDRGVSANDALAYLLMKERDLDEVYSFDRHFDQLDVTRLPRWAGTLSHLMRREMGQLILFLGGSSGSNSATVRRSRRRGE